MTTKRELLAEAHRARAEIGLDLRASASIDGAITNRVRVSKAKPRAARPVYYKQDKAARGEGHRVICVSLPPAILAVIDAAAERLGMCRSEYLRTAALAMAVAPAMKGSR